MELALALRLTTKRQIETELLLLGNLACTVQEAALNNIKIKGSVKILGVHFTYDIHAKQKLNINELISSIQLKGTVSRYCACTKL